MKNLIFFSKKVHFFSSGTKKPPQLGRIGEEKQYKDYEKNVLFDGYPPIERGQFVKLLFGILFGATLEPEGFRQFDM